MKLSFSIILLFIAGMVSAQKKQIIFPPPVLGMDVPDFIDFCQVPAHKGESVYTRFIYSGSGEDWSLHSPNQICTNITAELLIPDSIEVRPEFLRVFKQVHKNNISTYLIIDAIGIYEDSKKTVYGHFGSKVATFKVKWIVDVQKFKK